MFPLAHRLPPWFDLAVINRKVADECDVTLDRAPALAIYAMRPGAPPDWLAAQFAQAAAFSKRGRPTVRVVVLPNADHFVFRSHESDVLREMRAFIDSLPPAP